MSIINSIVDTSFGVPVSDAYIKFINTTWSSETGGVLIFAVWANQAAYDEEKNVLTIIEIESGNIFNGVEALAYAEIKKNPDFLNAVDV